MLLRPLLPLLLLLLAIAILLPGTRGFGRQVAMSTNHDVVPNAAIKLYAIQRDEKDALSLRYSKDRGVSWRSPPGLSPTIMWSAIACSDDGLYVLATSYQGFVYLSTDYMHTINVVPDLVRRRYVTATVSPSGKYMAVATEYGTNGDADTNSYAYYSSNFGVDWPANNVLTKALYVDIASYDAGSAQRSSSPSGTFATIARSSLVYSSKAFVVEVSFSPNFQSPLQYSPPATVSQYLDAVIAVYGIYVAIALGDGQFIVLKKQLYFLNLALPKV